MSRLLIQSCKTKSGDTGVLKLRFEMISTNLYLFFTFQAEERTDAHVEGGEKI